VKLTKKASVLSIRGTGALSTASSSSSISSRLEKLGAQVDKLSWSRQKKGETLEQLYNTDFFTSRVDSRNQKRKLTRLPVLALSTPREVSLRPSSMLTTPTTFYNSGNALEQVDGSSRPFSFAPRRQLSNVLPTLNEDDAFATVVEAMLPPIAESNVDGVSELSATSSKYVGTHGTVLRLSSGSVVTVLTPERDAWKRSNYLHGDVCLQGSEHLAPRLSLVGLALWEADDEVLEDVHVVNDGVVDSTVSFFNSMICQPGNFSPRSDNDKTSPFLATPSLDAALAEAIANMRIGSHMRKSTCLV